MNAVTKMLNDHGSVRAAGKPAARLSNKDEYRSLCEAEPSIPIFGTNWWLDAAAGPGNWDVALVKTNGRIVGAMAFGLVERYGMKVIANPPLTPVLEPWILPNGERTSSRLANEQKIMQSLIEQLPRFDHFTMAWGKGASNWLPFYWNGFSQTTGYTYVLALLNSQDALWNGLESARRKHCKRGVERFKLRVRDDLPVDAFIALQNMTLEHRGVTASYSDDLLRRVDAVCEQRNCRKILTVVDEAGRHCAGTYTVWYNNCAYALIKGSDPAMHHTGAPSLCQWESIKFCATIASSYDFLGNMNESIEPYVRSFGTVQTPVFAISKTPSRLLRTRQALKSVFPSRR
jgi:hypothetical protein